MMPMQMRMPMRQNLHTHTTYCDGRETPEAMIQAAIEARCDSIGFSGHSYVESVTPLYSMSDETMRAYVGEVSSLKVKYKDRIPVYLGIEQDYHSGVPADGFDFVIGSVHFIMKGGEVIEVDGIQRRQLAEYYGGDYYAMLAEYFAMLGGVAVTTGADIIGHFDIVTKRNFDNSLFDESHPRYIGPALDAMDEILKSCNLFEVNTGAMYRRLRREPFPSQYMLKELRKRGGEVLLSSDSHDIPSLCYMHEEACELLRACGYRYVKHLTASGFIAERIV